MKNNSSKMLKKMFSLDYVAIALSEFKYEPEEGVTPFRRTTENSNKFSIRTAKLGTAI